MALACAAALFSAPGIAVAAPRPAGSAARPAAAAVRLLADATVRGPLIRLGDVARIDTRSKAASRLAAVEVASAPLPGRTRVVRAEDVRVRLLGAGLDPACLAKGEAPRCTVTRAAQVITTEALVAEARRYVEGREASGEGRLEIETIGTPRAMVLPEGRLSLSVEGVGIPTGATRRVVVSARVDGEPAGKSSVSLRLRRYVRVAVSSGPIKRGETLSDERVRVEERDLAALPEGALTEGTDWSGWQALQAIAAGVPITARMAAEPAVVHRGDTLTVRVRTGGITVAVPVTAVEDGRRSGFVRVRNPQSNREFRARVVDEQTVEAEL